MRGHRESYARPCLALGWMGDTEFFPFKNSHVSRFDVRCYGVVDLIWFEREPRFGAWTPTIILPTWQSPRQRNGSAAWTHVLRELGCNCEKGEVKGKERKFQKISCNGSIWCHVSSNKKKKNKNFFKAFLGFFHSSTSMACLQVYKNINGMVHWRVFTKKIGNDVAFGQNVFEGSH